MPREALNSQTHLLRLSNASDHLPAGAVHKVIQWVDTIEVRVRCIASLGTYCAKHNLNSSIDNAGVRL